MPGVAVIIQTRAKPGTRAEILSAFKRLLAPRADENDAQTLVIWAADDADDDVFYLVEVYRDRAAMEENAKAPWFWDYLGEVGPLLDGEPQVSTATPYWSKGIS